LVTLAAKFSPREYICDGKILKLISHGISNPLTMIFWIQYPWYIKPPSHGILTLLPMVCQTPFPWYFERPTHGISNALWYIEPLAFILIRNEGVQNTMRVQFTMSEMWPRCQYTIGFKIPYGTGTTTCVHLLNLLTNIWSLQMVCLLRELNHYTQPRPQVYPLRELNHCMN